MQLHVLESYVGMLDQLQILSLTFRQWYDASDKRQHGRGIYLRRSLAIQTQLDWDKT